MKDKRYETVKILIDNNLATSFVKLFDSIPISVVATDMGSNFNRLSHFANNPEDLKLKEIFAIAKLFDVDNHLLIKLIMKQIDNKPKGMKKI